MTAAGGWRFSPPPENRQSRRFRPGRPRRARDVAVVRRGDDVWVISEGWCARLDRAEAITMAVSLAAAAAKR